MKRLTLFFWGRSVLLGCALAGLAGMARAQLFEMPTVVSQNFDITASTLRQTTPALMMSLGAGRNLTLRLDESATLTDRTIAGLEANIVPKRMKLSSITVYDTAGTLIPERFESTPVTLYKDGETGPVATATGMERGQEAVTLPTEGGMVAAVPVTFTFASEVSVETEVRYSLAFNWKESSVLPAVLAYPSKSLGDIALPGVSLEGSTGGGYVPHVRFQGTAYIHRFILPVKKGETSLDALLGQAMEAGKSLTDYVKDSKADAVVLVAELSEGAGLTMDVEVPEGVAVVAASYYATKSLVDHGLESTTVPTITFKNAVSVTGPFTVRGGTPTGSSEPMAAELRLAGDTTAWLPTDFMLRADLRLDCPVPKTEGGWFASHSITIASGRRLVLDHSNYTEEQLPDVAFASADSTLVLAGQNQDSSKTDIPEKYRAVLRNSSGVIALGRNATIAPDPNAGTAIEVGYNGLTHTLALLAPEATLTFPKAVSLGNGEGSSGTLYQHIGTIKGVDGALPGITFASGGYGAFRQDAGEARLEEVEVASGAEALFRVGDGIDHDDDHSTLTATTSVERLTAQSAGAAATVEVFSDGRLEIGNLSLNRAIPGMILRGGTLAAAVTAAQATFGPYGIGQDGVPESEAETLHVVGGGMLDGNGGSLMLSAVSGNGELTARGQVTIETLYNYDGIVQAEGADPSKLTIEKILGSTGTVTVGYLGYKTPAGADDDAAALAAVTAAAAGYRGTLAFTKQYANTLDFSVLRDVIDFPYALDFSQMTTGTITMRLDQYVGTTVRWPADCSGITFNLIESGAYGGEAVIPTFPGTIHFKRYNPQGGGLLEADIPVTVTPNENGVTSDVTWNPSFTGQGAWIDVEFNGTSKNTGWFSLKGEHGEVDDALYNGLLLGNGTNHSGKQVVMTDEENAVGYVKGVFVETGHPVSKGVKLYSRPYVSYSSLTYPEAFSVVLRVMTPNVGKKCILQLGANHTSDKAGSVNGKTDSLVFATGDSGNHLVVWLVRGNSGKEAMTKVAEVELANATTAAHVVSVVFDGQTFRTYLDGALLTTYTPDTAVELGTGLQVGAMLGQEDTTGDQSVGFVNGAIWAELGPIEETDGTIPNYTSGVLDYIRFYKGVLTDKAMEELTKASPPVLENVRFVRDVPGLSDFGLWVGNEQNKPWTKETWNGSAWVSDGTYAEPEEGAEIRLRVTASGEHLLQVNVARDTTNRFYSTDRLYPTLVVEPKEGTTAAGTVRLVPVGVESAEYENTPSQGTSWITGNAWYTKLATEDDAQTGATFHYGRLRFLGGAEDPIHDDTTITDFHGAGYLLPSGTMGVTGIFDAGVCWFSELAPFYLKVTGETQPNVLRLVAGLSLTRGVDDESRTWQLTGPVTVEGTSPDGTDPVQGNANAVSEQLSQDVWVAKASDAAKWTFFDRTLTEGGETNGNGATKGLFAQGLQTPGRLYLDLTDEASKTQYQGNQAFSAQKWYRYGYPGAGTATPSGMEPKEASENDFALAIAFQVRLPEDATVATLNMDAVPTAKVQTFFVEPVAAPAGDAPTLSLKSDGTTQLAIQKSVIVRTPLDVSNVGTGAAKDSLALARGVEIHRGDAMEGKYYGAYISGNQTFDWPLGVSSVPRLEVASGGLVTLSGPQDLRKYQTVLAVGEGATLRQADAGNTLRAAGLELGEGATFAFNSTATDGGEGAAVMGVQLDGNLTLTGDATLASEAAGGKTVFSAAAFRGPVPVEGETWAAGATLTLDVTTDATTWRIPTVDWANLGLTKTGPGTVTFSGGVSTPPTVAGMVSVNEGKLCVAPAAATAEDSSESATHSGPGIGHRGLHVAAGATLAKTDETASESAEHVLACIPNGQTLSGAGTIDGFLRLCEGATFDASECVTKGHPLTVTKGLAVAGNAGANITVALPEGYEAPQPFFEVRRSESHARRRLKSMKGADQWDTVAKIEGGTTVYYAQRAGMPRPKDPTDGPTEYDAAFAEQMIRYYRGDNAAYLGAAYAFTQAGTYRLNEEEIVNAFRCFEGVWTFDHEKAEGAGQAEGVTYVDAQNFYMAYEFGISRVTVAPVKGLSDHALYVIAEVTVKQKVTEQWPNLARGLTRTAAFAPGVAFELWGHRPGAAVTTAEGTASTPSHKDFTGYVKFDGVVELSAFDGGPLAAGQTRSGGTRWFAIPYTEENFPQRTTTSLKVKVIPPATSQEEAAARLLRAREAR